MGCEELIDSLRKAAEEKSRLIWKEVEVEAGAIKEGLSAELSRLREECTNHCGTEEDQLSDILSEAKIEARKITMIAEKALSERLFAIASRCLPALIREDYKEDFGALARELPDMAWESVTVNPRDRGIAEELFSYAKVIEEKSIAGGFAVSTEGGRVRVDNTLEKRLDRAWTEMIPAVIKEVYNALAIETSPSGH